jgi:hypothetical protein
MTYLKYCKKFCKCHNIPPLQNNKKSLCIVIFFVFVLFFIFFRYIYYTFILNLHFNSFLYFLSFILSFLNLLMCIQCLGPLHPHDHFPCFWVEPVLGSSILLKRQQMIIRKTTFSLS